VAHKRSFLIERSSKATDKQGRRTQAMAIANPSRSARQSGMSTRPLALMKVVESATIPATAVNGQEESSAGVVDPSDGPVPLGP